MYGYNSGEHTTVLLSPNELMMGRRLRALNELLRRASVAEEGPLLIYYQRLFDAMRSAHECAKNAWRREQARQACYYDRKVRQRRTFAVGDRAWVYQPPRGPKESKFMHQ